MPFEIKLVEPRNKSFIFVDVEASDTVDELKSKLFDRTGIAGTDCAFIHAGRDMCGSQTMADYNVARGSTVHVVFRLRRSETGEQLDLFRQFQENATPHEASSDVVAASSSQPADVPAP